MCGESIKLFGSVAYEMSHRDSPQVLNILSLYFLISFCLQPSPLHTSRLSVSPFFHYDCLSSTPNPKGTLDRVKSLNYTISYASNSMQYSLDLFHFQATWQFRTCCSVEYALHKGITVPSTVSQTILHVFTPGKKQRWL